MEDRVLLSTITVTSAGDTIDPNDGVVTLREAITAANTNAVSGDAPAGAPGLDSIAFNIPGAGLHTIAPATPLPAITEPIVINGLTQPGSSANTLSMGDDAVLTIELNGAALSTSVGGLQVEAGGSGSTIRGLVINRFGFNSNLGFISASGISLLDSNNNTIVGNFIGTDSTGSTELQNYEGVTVRGENNTIGSPAPADRNVISGNGTDISLTNTGSALNVVQGNYIGVNVSGNGYVVNTDGGVFDYYGVYIKGVFQGATQGGALIGGATSAPGQGAGNVISGNTIIAGVFVENPSDSVLGPVTIQGNIIGLGADGTTDVGGDGSTGVGVGCAIDATSGAILIGGPDASTRNVISGNGTGIGYSAAAATVQGNYIGTDVTGTLNRGNGNGIAILGDNRDAANPAATTMTIGGTAAGAGNVISGNHSNGVYIRNANVVIQGNRIGTSADGVYALGNGFFPNSTIGSGVEVINIGSYPPLQVSVGSAVDGYGNVIAFNGFGVSTRVSGVTILRNSMFGNFFQGIYYEPGITAPPPPVLTGATTTTISGTFTGAASTTYRVEFFATPGEVDEGKTFLGSTDVTTDASGHADLSFQPVGGVPAGQMLTATATSALGTSMFSTAFNVGVSIVPLPNPVPAGDDLTYTISVVKAGPTAGLGVALSNAIPANTTFVSFVAPSGWTVSNPAVGGTGTVAAHIVSLSTGSAVFTLIVHVDPATAEGTYIINTANVSATNRNNPDDDFATAIVSVSAFIPPAGGGADLAVTMTDSSGPLIVGDNITYTITARNNGPDPATGVVLTDVLPTGLMLVTSNLRIYDPASPTLTALVGDLAPGAEATWTLVAQASTAGTFTNVIQVQGLQTDPDPANSTASLTATVTTQPPVIEGPQVVSVVRNGVHWQPTSIVVTFNADLDPARAQDVANYRIQAPGRRLVPVLSAIYDAASRSVTIRPAHRLNIHHPFSLTINGRSPSGLTDASGNLLDGAGDGQSGTDYQATVLGYGVRTRATPIHLQPVRKPMRTPLRPIHPHAALHPRRAEVLPRGSRPGDAVAQVNSAPLRSAPRYQLQAHRGG